jgi:sugar phosphate permease
METGHLLMLLAFGAITGGPIGGWFSDQAYLSRKGTILLTLGCYSLSLFSFAGFLEIRHPFWYPLLLFSMGFFSASGIVLYGHAKELFPLDISGTVMTLINFFTMAGGAVLMPVLGKVIESFHRTGDAYPAEAYHLAFLICFLGMAASLIFYSIPTKSATRQ